MPWMTLGNKIRRLRKSLGLNQKPFGKLVGATQSTVSRWESDSQVPEYEQLRALAALAKEPVEAFLMNPKPSGGVAGTPITYSVRVIGSVQAGLWVEALEWPRDKQFEIYVPLESPAASLSPRALRIDGPSMNLVFPEGTYVICAEAIALGVAHERNGRADPLFQSGDYVIVQRRRSDGLIEATVKEYVLDPEGHAWLWPRSSHPEFQQPWRIPDADEDADGDDLRITARVLGVYRAFRKP